MSRVLHIAGHRYGARPDRPAWRRRLLAVLALVLLTGTAACQESLPEPLGPKPSKSPNAGPAPAPDGETPEHAAKRLFPAAYAEELAAAAEPWLIEGSKPGRPVPVTAEYASGGALLVRWILPDDAKAVSGDMFAAMWPSAMQEDGFFVPIVKDGRVVFDFSVGLEGGHWVGHTSPSKDLPIGDVYELDRATRKLRDLLGEGTRVRPTIFLPSGHAFAVGDNGGREAAVYLGISIIGKGVNSDLAPKKLLPESGQLFTQAQLQELYAP